MTPQIQVGNATVYAGNNLDVLPTLADNSVDSIVCDPPYELGFMGKSWDNSGIAYSVELWQQCLRVLKPGGHLLAFGGTRTWHRLAVAIEDAGFEIRDNIAWLYGSGFPKSHNISKAIDKITERLLTGLNEHEQKFCDWMQQHSGITISQSKELLGSARFITGEVEIVNTATKEKPHLGRRAMIPTFQAWQKIKPLLAIEAPEWVEALVKEPPKPAITHPSEWNSGKGEGTAGTNEYAGWGTALKPAHEPIVVARKPVIGTVAENVLQYGTGALNIDASRIGTDSGWSYPNGAGGNGFHGGVGRNPDGSRTEPVSSTQGRWPANIILDEYTAQVLDQQSGVSKSLAHNRPHDTKWGFSVAKDTPEGYDYNSGITGYSDSGGASRFFYVAKANKKDRNEGLENLPEVMARKFAQDETTLATMPFGKLPVKNFHPTVKPTALMQYLIRLVTPDNGTVLDPFCGSGSTGKAAILENKSFIGIELTPEYLPIIQGRLEHAYQTMLNKPEEDDLFA